MLLLKLNPIEPPWYGPVCPVVWEGRRREVSPYSDQRRFSATQPSRREWLSLPQSGHSLPLDRDGGPCPTATFDLPRSLFRSLSAALRQNQTFARRGRKSRAQHYAR